MRAHAFHHGEDYIGLMLLYGGVFRREQVVAHGFAGGGVGRVFLFLVPLPVVYRVLVALGACRKRSRYETCDKS